MENLLHFFNEVGKLKDMPRRGWVLRGVKNPETIAEHSFRAALMAWILGSKKKLDMERLLKIALVHDLCEIYAGDATPYDSLLPKNKKDLKKLMSTWPRFTKKEKQRIAEKKHKKEKAGLEKLTINLAPKLRYELINLWMDYEQGLTPEGRFFKQADRLENFLQAIEYSQNKEVDEKPWWMQAREMIDDPVLLELIEQISKKFHKK
ncbi:HD domain-containing protein [Patescibacteria group bacterium]|nr:HD domain-containing protein [Patescibacteria group bacterium]